MKKILVLSILFLFLLISYSNVIALEEPQIPTIPNVEVRFSLGPYADGSYSYIGSQKGWFEEVGITLLPRPFGKVIDASQWASLLIAGTADVTQNHTKTFVPILEETTKQKMFLYTNMNFGASILGDPKKYKSLEEFIEEGSSIEEAYKKTIEQIKGKTLLSEINPANKGMLYYAFEKAGMDVEKDVKLMLLEDPKILAMMISGKSDIASPSGIPTIVQLVQKGFKPIIDIRMEMKYADVSPGSPDFEVLQTTLYAGIASTDEWLEKNHDTALRISSVYYRIIDFMVNNPDEAALIHQPFINGIAGTSLTTDELKGIYSVTQPLTTFEKQEQWFLDKKIGYYWENPIMADIKMWEEKGVLPKGKYAPKDVSVADKFYLEMLQLKNETEKDIKEASNLIAKAVELNKSVVNPTYLIDRAKYYHSIRNYLDASRFSKASIEWANYILETK